MRARHPMPGIVVSGVLLTLTALPLRLAGQTRPEASRIAEPDPDQVIAGLRQVAGSLTNSVRQFQAHLDREIASRDRGVRTKDGRRIPAADADLAGGAADVAQTALRKLFAARMLSARNPGYVPDPLADFDRIQSLLAEAHTRVATANDVMRRLLTIPASQLNSKTDAALRLRSTELKKARAAATEAAQNALMALPFDLPEDDPAEDQMAKVWNSPSPGLSLQTGKSMTLIHGPFRRVSLTDSGLEDQGRRLFYQEEWEQRQGATTLKRWAVAVNTNTGQHTMLRRYPIREFRDELDKVYKSQGRDYLFNAESEPSAEPTAQDISTGLAEAARSREKLQDAILYFKTRIRDGLARNDALLGAQNKPGVDDDLPIALRESLFAIRGHMAGIPDIVDAEKKVRRSAEEATRHARIVEAMAAWMNGNALEREGPSGDSAEFLQALNRADMEIDLTRSAERNAVAVLPPDESQTEAQFPALMKDIIVRIRGMGASSAQGGTIRCKQEIWRFAGSARGDRRVQRTILFLDLGVKTGSQIPAGREVRYYKVDSGATLERIYDENAAQ